MQKKKTRKNWITNFQIKLFISLIKKPSKKWFSLEKYTRRGERRRKKRGKRILWIINAYLNFIKLLFKSFPHWVCAGFFSSSFFASERTLILIVFILPYSDFLHLLVTTFLLIVFLFIYLCFLRCFYSLNFLMFFSSSLFFGIIFLESESAKKTFAVCMIYVGF